MSLVKSDQKLRTLRHDITYGVDYEPARKVIPKFYDMASTISQHMPQHNPEIQKSKHDKNLHQKLHEQLKHLRQLFIKYKESRSQQIRQFNQVEYYMYEQTERILHQFQLPIIQPPIIQLVLDKLTSFTRIFIKPETYYIEEDKVEIEETLSSLSQKKPVTQRHISSFKNLNALSMKSLPEDLNPISLNKMWENVAFYYENHRLDEAYNQIKRAQQVMILNPKNTPLTKQRQDLSNTIKFEYKTMSEFYEHFYDTGYTFDKQQKGISLWYKIIGQKDVAIKVQAEVDITIQNFLCIASQIDLFEDYMPFTYGTRELKSISRNEKIGTSKIYIPLLSDRETYFYAAAYDRLRTKGSIFFFSKTINEDLEYQQKYNFKVPKQSQLVRLDYKYYILEYIPLTSTRGKIRMVSSIDLKMDYLPLFVINKSARIFSFDYMSNYHKINKKFKGSKWEMTKLKKKSLYDYFQAKINEFLEQKKHKR